MTATARQFDFPELSPVAAHHPMGFSTGVFEEDRGDWPALVALAAGSSPYAVELSALSGGELPGLLEYLRANPSLPFRYVSVHAPSKAPLGNEADLLGRLPLWVRSIVVHPDVLPGDLAPYRRLGSRLVIENMDTRKAAGQDVRELEEIFAELPDAGFCLDVAHAWSLDPSEDQHLAHGLLDAFRLRLRHVHLSSLDVEGSHLPLSAEHEELFAPVLDRCRDVPWILEATAPRRWS